LHLIHFTKGKKMGKATKGKRVQASKRVRGQGPDNMGRAFIELRKGSRTSPHRDKTVYNRNDFRFDDWD
jgi:hypothetical protein